MPLWEVVVRLVVVPGATLVVEVVDKLVLN